MFFSNYVAVDITNSEIRVISMERGRFEKWATAPLSEGVVKSGLVREPQALGVVVDNLFKSLRLRRNHVILTVTGLPFIYRTVSMPARERIPSEAIERESRREMSLGEEDMYLTWQVTETQKTAREADYFVLGVPRSALNPLVEALSYAGIKQYMIDIKPLALARVAGLKDALVVSLEPDNIDAVLVEDGLVRVMHSFNPIDKSGNKLVIANEIANGLNRAIKSFGRDFPERTLPTETPILISGRILPDDPLLALVQEACGRYTTLISSSQKVPSGLPVGIYAPALGLISKKMPKTQPQPYRDINLDLLKGIKRLHTHKFQTAWILAAILSLALAVLVYESNGLRAGAAGEVAVLQQQAEVMNQQLSDAQKINHQTLAAKQAAAQKAEDYEAQLSAINKTIALINSQRIDFGSQIAVISNGAPAGAELVTMDFQSNRIKVAGRATDGFEVLKLAEALEKSGSFSSVRVEQLTPADPEGVEFQLSILSKTDSSNLIPQTSK